MDTEFFYKDSFEALVAAFTTDAYLEEIKTAKAEFFSIIGEVQPGEELYEVFMNLFLNWYLLDRKMTTKLQTPIELYLDQFTTGKDGRESYFHLNNTNLSLFEYLKDARGSCIIVKDVFVDEKYKIYEPRTNHGFVKKGFFEGRLVPTEYDYFIFFNDFLFHPEIAYPFIKDKIKKEVDKNLIDRTTFMKRLTNLRLKLSRYQNIDAETVYSDATYEKAFNKL